MTIERLDLNSLVLFYEVVNAKSITKAAALLRMPKSTISRKLTLLEAQVGSTLLRKGQRTLSTTEAGSILYNHCSRLVDEIDNAKIYTAEHQSELRGTLRISLPIDFGIAWLSRAISKFVLKYPAIHLEIDVNSRQINLRDEPYDLTIQLGPLKESGLTYRRLATITRGVYASPTYLAHKGVPSSIDRLSEYDCIVTEQQRQDGVWNFVSLGNKTRYKLTSVEGRVMVNNIGVARELAIGGVGLAMLPNIMCKNDVKLNRLVRVLPGWEGPSMHATALILNRKGIPNKTRAFLEFISDQLTHDTL